MNLQAITSLAAPALQPGRTKAMTGQRATGRPCEHRTAATAPFRAARRLR